MNKSISISVGTMTLGHVTEVTNDVTYYSFMINARECAGEIYRSHWYWPEMAAKLLAIII